MAFVKTKTAAVGFEIGFDKKQIKELKDIAKRYPKKANSIMRQSINEGVRGGVTTTSQEVRKVSPLAAKWIKRRVETQKAFGGRLSGLIRITGKPVLLGFFNPIAKRIKIEGRKGKVDQVSVIILKRKGRRVVPKAFMRHGKGGTPLILRRQFRGNKQVSRYPLEPRFGPSIATLVRRTPGVEKKITDKVADKMLKRVRSKVDFFLKEGR